MSDENTKSRAGTDWARLRAMSDEESEARAVTDPDAPPMTDEQLAQMRRPPLSKRVRFKLGLTQQQFADRFCIPVSTLRDWDQGRNEPDAAARALLNAIAAYPVEVAKAQEGAA